MNHRYFVRLSFQGTHYSGWQIQENAVSVQEKLNQALTVISGHEITTTGCGRTDAGVHARMFYAHFDLSEPIADSGRMLYQLNAILPDDIAIHEIIAVAENAHARFDATSWTYEYFMCRYKNPFLRDYAFHGFRNPYIVLMQQACEILKSHIDFSSFSKSNTQVKTNLCKITHAHWEFRNEMLVFTITADRFLRGMVRAIVGTLLDVGTAKMPPEELNDILLAQNRSQAGTSAPAAGLYLTRISYPYLTDPTGFRFPG